LLDRFSDRMNELEAIVREVAIDITTGTVVERLPPRKIWERTGDRVSMMGDLMVELNEYLSIMKPEKVPTIRREAQKINERLRVFRETLGDQSLDPEASSRRAVEELRQALVEMSDFLSLCKEVRANPSPVISAIFETRGTHVLEVPPETWEKVERLKDLIKATQATYADVAELTARIEGQLDAIRSEYESLVYSLRVKEAE
jgi:hypothetical protein